MWQYGLLLLMMQFFSCQARFFEGKTVQEKTIEASHKKITQWEKSLTKQERQHLSDVLKLHEELHDNYKAKPSAESTKILVQMHNVLEKNMLPNWESFYKPYLHAQMFDTSYQKWKAGLSADQLRKYNRKIQLYDGAYQAYQTNPQNDSVRQRMLQSQEVIQGLMSK